MFVIKFIEITASFFVMDRDGRTLTVFHLGNRSSNIVHQYSYAVS